MDITLLREVYSEILKGYTRAQDYYIKHITPLEEAELNIRYSYFFNEAIQNGVLNEADQLKELIDAKVWTREDEFLTAKENLEIAQKTKEKLFRPDEVEAAKKNVEEAEKKLNEIYYDRVSLIRTTAESYAASQIELESVCYLFFYDKELTKPVFQLDMEEQQFDSAVNILKGVNDKFKPGNIKHISINPIFTNTFYLCENLRDFFGKPMTQMTNYQISLIRNGNYFKRIFQEVGEVLEGTPEEIEDSYKIWKSNKETQEKLAANKNNLGEYEDTARQQGGSFNLRQNYKNQMLGR